MLPGSRETGLSAHLPVGAASNLNGTCSFFCRVMRISNRFQAPGFPEGPNIRIRLLEEWRVISASFIKSDGRVEVITKHGLASFHVSRKEALHVTASCRGAIALRTRHSSL